LAPIRINRHNKLALAAIAAFVLVIVYGCSSSLDKLEIVRIEKIQVDSIMQEIIAVRAEVAIKNPYSTSARLKNIQFDVSLTDHPVAYGKLTGSTEMKGGATILLTVPLAISCKKITEQDFGTLFQETGSYTIEGSAILERPFGPRTLAINAHNSMPDLEYLKIVLTNQSATEIISPDASGVDQLANLIRKRELSLRLYNPLNFPLSVHNFGYEIRLGKAVIADGNATGDIALQPGTNRISVSVRPRPFALAEDLLNALLQRSIPDLTLASDFIVERNGRQIKIHLVYSPEDVRP